LDFGITWDNILIVPEWRNWQTRCVQVAVIARSWRFESSLGHQVSALFFLRLFLDP
jgi:hypothetical protein